MSHHATLRPAAPDGADRTSFTDPRKEARRALPSGEAGMSTAEYAVGTVAACGFATLLWTILHSGAVREALTALFTHALHLL